MPAGPKDRLWPVPTAQGYTDTASFFFFFLTFYLFIYLWLCWVFTATQAFSGCGEWGLLFSCGTQVSHCSDFSCCRAQALRHMSFSRGVWVNNCGSWALEHRLSSCGVWALLLCGMWDLPGSGIKPESSALAGDSLPAHHQGSPQTLPFEPPSPGHLQDDPHTFPRTEPTDNSSPTKVHRPVRGRTVIGPASPQLWVRKQSTWKGAGAATQAGHTRIAIKLLKYWNASGTEQNPTGPSQDRSSTISSALAPLWST